ncbi:MAG TPA: type VII secretion protein EccB [Jatrophihabitantaceae bacterium]
MWTQRDQIQAYQFLRRRLVSALVVADANHPVSPGRRLVIGSALGVAATVLVVGGFGIAGVIHPSANPDWRRGGQVIVEKETGARFVLGQDQKLHPILNYASARLLAGGNGGAKTITVAAGKLAGAPRGAMLGLVGAPDSLPQSGRLLAGPWTACTEQPAARPSASAPVATLIVGPHAAGTPLGATAGVVVRTASGTRFLLSAGQRFRIADELAAVSLGYDAVPALTVSPAFVDAVPAGRDLRPITVAGAGDPGPALRGAATRVGQVLQVGTVGAGSRYYLVRADGLVAITQVEAGLVLGNPADAAAYGAGPARPLTASAAAVAGAPRSAQPPATGYPDGMPRPIAPLEPGAALCAEGDGLHDAQLFTAPDLPLPAGAAVTGTGADQVAVPPGRGALVASTQSPGAPAGTTYLITDTGRRYPVPNSDAASALGYGGSTPVAVAPPVLALLPTGVTLDPGAAQQVVSGGFR